MKKFGVAVAVVGALALSGCGAMSEDEKAEAERCVEQLETTLAEAGSGRDLTQDEIDACNDADQRAFILGE